MYSQKTTSKKAALQKGKYNQIANYVYMQSEINIKIGKNRRSNISRYSRIKSKMQKRSWDSTSSLCRN